MKTTLAFDVHGTLVDASKVLEPLSEFLGEKAIQVFDTWKYKQREYAFRRRLMEKYVNFSICTQQALDYACMHHQVSLSDEEKKYILEYSKTLPAFPEAREALLALRNMGFRLFALSNGPLHEVKDLLDQANLGPIFKEIFSVEHTKTFKPDPAVYEYFLRHSHTGHKYTWFISGNSFDVIGAKNVNLKAIWIRRSRRTVMDPWGIEPDKTLNNLQDVVEFFNENESG